MLLRTAYIRRSRKSQRLKQRLAVVAMLGVAACAALLYATRSPAPPSVAADVSGIVEVAATGMQAQAGQAAAPVASRAARRVYPYSIVPGGVAGRDDVVRVMKMDKVVAAHYASFQVDKASVATVSKPRAVYVSYRKGDKVYWTAGKHTLAAGETVLTDGSSEIRGRCGNRISDVAMLPVEAKGPSESELDAASDEAGDADEGSAENVSFTADSLVDGGGRAFALNNFFGAGLAGGTAAASARGGSTGIGLPYMPDLAEMMRIANSGLLLSAASQASGTGDTNTGNTNTGGSAAAPAPQQNGSTGGTTGGTADGSTGGSEGAPSGDPGNAGGGSTGSNGGGTGDGGTTPSTGPVIPAPQTAPEAPNGGLPQVLQPTQPIPVPTGSADGKDGASEVPEPGAPWLLALGFAGLLAARRRRRA
ncbi:PEP-CTERM sorting domain-containing protein [Massilia sp. TN1-12]|uniref:PEP-CTERM sorting domain-containing protein n=1 Tax=Massilia paldalensis TaxID=3377675 RepID=UPI00384DFDED